MMSYDPSSLNRNKTLLEAIEEVKKFLIANPCYKVFYANTNYLVGTTTYSKTYIDDPDSIAEYDVVFFNNNYYGKVESVGDSTFTIIGATNFKGDTGAQGTPGTPGTPGADGQDGADGTDGVSITNVSIDSSNHLICTLSDGTSIDAGLIPSAVNDHYVYLTSSSGTLTADELAKLQYPDSVILTIGGAYHLGYTTASNTLVFEMFDTTGNQTKRQTYTIDTTTRAYTFANAYLPIVKDNINSQTATSGQVLTADGTGGASWETPTTPSVEGTAVKSTGETSGKVLTADGSGGASWETAGGGGSPLYCHTIYVNKTLTNSGGCAICFDLITSAQSSAFASFNALCYFINNNDIMITASGKANNSGDYSDVVRAFKSSNTVMTLTIINSSTHAISNMTIDSATIYDTVRTL